MTDFSSGSGARGSLPPLLADAGRLGRAIEAGAVALWEWHIAEDMMRISPRLAELLGLAPPLLAFPARRFFSLVLPNDIALLKSAMSEPMATDAAFAHEFRVRREDTGELRFLCHEGRVVERNPSGAAAILAGASHDVTERRLKHEASELLNRELSHRIKNLLSVVGSLATMAGERRPETRAFIAAFQARLSNLAAAHDLLIQADWGPVMLDGLAERTLASIGMRDRVDLAASGLVVGSHDTQTVALVLHELGTNAIKYGALSNSDGRVSLRFEMRPEAGGADPATLVILWQEKGGPEVIAPVSKGFGITLLERLARRQDPDAPVLDWTPHGLSCNITLRLTPPRPKPEGSVETPA
jgi:two-component sensor histidine kinase